MIDAHELRRLRKLCRFTKDAEPKLISARLKFAEAAYEAMPELLALYDQHEEWRRGMMRSVCRVNLWTEVG